MIVLFEFHITFTYMYDKLITNPFKSLFPPALGEKGI